MYRGRGGTSSTRGRGRGHGSSPRGLFAEGIWHCDCTPRLPAERFRVKKDGPNHGRWFYTCQDDSKGKKAGCGFFLWEDDAKLREEAAVLSGKRTESGRESLQEGWNAGRSRADQQQQSAGKGLFAGHGQRAADRDESTESPTPSPPIKPEYSGTTRTKRKAAASDLDNDEFGLDNVSERDPARLADSLAQPETPHKARKTGVYATPGTTAVKRKLPWEVATTPAGHASATDSYFDTPSKHATQASSVKHEPQTPAEPQTLGTISSPLLPTRYKDALQNPEDSDSSLTRAVMDALSAVNLPTEVFESLRTICIKHDLKYHGVVKGRDMSRLATKAKDAKITELHARIASLEADWEVERSLNRMTRWESVQGSE